MSAPVPADFGYFCRIATRWGDVDRMGHVNNAKFFTYDEQARTTYMEALFGAPVDKHARGTGLILARIACDFVAQLHHPAEIDFGMRIVRIGRSSLQTEGAAFVGERCYARTQGVLVCFDYAANQSVPVPEAMRQKILAFEPVTPEGAA